MKIGSSVKNRSLFYIIKYCFVFIVSLLVGCETSENSEVFNFSGNTMGTTYSIKIVHNKNVDPQNIKLKVDSLLIDVNQKMSTYIDSSEISRFNSFKDTQWVEVSNDLLYVLTEAINIEELSNNVYDVTIGPVVNLWGFGPNSFAENRIPTDSEIEKAKLMTGVNNLVVDKIKSRIKKTNPNLYIDLSSIAKGYGVDKVSEFLKMLGYTNTMVEIGGEVRTNGKNISDENWKIGISSPMSNGLQKVLSIRNLCVATSGDYFNYFEKNGKRYSHLIDPRTGKPIKHKLASVSVIQEKCIKADALATAISIMGEIEGFDFALKNKLPVFMIIREKNNFVEKFTPAFEKYIMKGN